MMIDKYKTKLSSHVLENKLGKTLCIGLVSISLNIYYKLSNLPQHILRRCKLLPKSTFFVIHVNSSDKLIKLFSCSY